MRSQLCELRFCSRASSRVTRHPPHPAGVTVNFDDINPGPSGRASVVFTGGLDWDGAVATTAAALPEAARAGVVSPPIAITNFPVPPGGAGAGALVFSASKMGAEKFTPTGAVLTWVPDAADAPTGRAADIVVTCYDSVGQQMGSGIAAIPAGQPNRVGFPPTCAGCSKVVVAPALSSTRIVMDDLSYVDLMPR